MGNPAAVRRWAAAWYSWMDPTEHVVASNVDERRGSRGHRGDRCRHFESKAAVRPVLVVVPGVVAKDCFEMMTAHHSALELDDEQHIELGELDGVHDEEVGGQDALGLGGDELFLQSARSWSETVASKDPMDRARRERGPLARSSP